MLKDVRKRGREREASKEAGRGRPVKNGIGGTAGHKKEGVTDRKKECRVGGGVQETGKI
jgi:hypothetical protein